MRMASFFLTAAVLALPGPALAQHAGHAAAVEETPPTGAQAQDAHSGSAGEDHSGHTMPSDPSTGESPPANDHSAHQQAEGPPDTSAEQADAHAGHAEPVASDDPHAAHGSADAAVPAPSAPPPEALSGPEHAADAYFGETAMALARGDLARMHGAVPAYRVLIDRLEARLTDDADTYLVDAQAWYGGDIDKLWIKAEGEGVFEGDFEGLELQALWSHAIGPWFDLQTGVRYDLQDGPDRAHLVVGVQGLAPYWIEVDAAAFLSDQGDLTGRVEAEHDIRITQKLILQPRAELEFSLQDIPAAAIGSGLTSAAIGARLRYQVTPLLGPYIGVEYDRSIGGTRELRSAANEDLGSLSFIAGVRAWF